MASPRPKPTVLKLLQGNPGRKALNKREPKPAAGVPEMPAHLSVGAKQFWKMQGPRLARIGCLTVVDGEAFAALCEARAAWVEAKKSRLKGGFVITSPNGYQVQSAFVGMERQALKQFMVLAQEFGMTPSSRSKIKAGDPPTPGGDDFDDLLNSA